MRAYSTASGAAMFVSDEIERKSVKPVRYQALAEQDGTSESKARTPLTQRILETLKRKHAA